MYTATVDSVLPGAGARSQILSLFWLFPSSSISLIRQTMTTWTSIDLGKAPRPAGLTRRAIAILVAAAPPASLPPSRALRASVFVPNWETDLRHFVVVHPTRSEQSTAASAILAYKRLSTLHVAVTNPCSLPSVLPPKKARRRTAIERACLVLIDVGVSRPRRAASDTGDKESVDCFSSPPRRRTHSLHCHIRTSFPSLSLSLPSHPIFRFGNVLAKSSHYFWTASRISGGIGGAAAAHLVQNSAHLFSRSASRRVLSCRKKISFSRRDSSYPSPDRLYLLHSLCFFARLMGQLLLFSSLLYLFS